jgi:predicted CXXCH cytochrome family protein
VKRILFACVLLMGSVAGAQTSDVLGAHDLSTSRVKGSGSAACMYCHVPHSGIGVGPLWGQTLSTQTYSLYSSDTTQNLAVQPPLGATSTLCLSCHDGTVAPGQVVPYGQIPMYGSPMATMGTNLEGSHPFSLELPLKDSANLVPSLAASQTTADPTKSVNLIKGNVECTSCHNAHVQRIDKDAPKFLVRDSRSGGLCLSCHTTQARTVNGRNNSLMQWATSVHATTGAQVSITSGLGGYSTVAEFACMSCHVPHNAATAGGLLRNPAPPLPNIDSTSQSCLTCHSGTDKLLQPLLNVFAEFEKKGHPYASTGNAHSASETVVLNQNRHATCADCHNAHASNQVLVFNAAPEIRPSQNGVAGIASDGSTLVTAAGKQYENCLRCHGNSTGKQALSAYGYLPVRAVFAGDPLNLIPQFGDSTISSHPVMHDRRSPLPQPSLRGYMLNLDGLGQGRSMGTSIFCTDCHNSDNNREFGGTGPNGPHGSQFNHILERRYEFSQVAAGIWPAGGPGTAILNLFPNPVLDPAAGGPYAICAKCHDLSNIIGNSSFIEHSRHIQAGFSCSVCHSAHGMGTSGSISGERLVNFDVNVVGQNGVLPISYSRATGTCNLVCHNKRHTPGT